MENKRCQAIQDMYETSFTVGYAKGYINEIVKITNLSFEECFEKYKSNIIDFLQKKGFSEKNINDGFIELFEELKSDKTNKKG